MSAYPRGLLTDRADFMMRFCPAAGWWLTLIRLGYFVDIRPLASFLATDITIPGSGLASHRRLQMWSMVTKWLRALPAALGFANSTVTPGPIVNGRLGGIVLLQINLFYLPLCLSRFLLVHVSRYELIKQEQRHLMETPTYVNNIEAHAHTFCMT